MCLVVSGLSPTMLSSAVDYCRIGGDLLLDSGAFIARAHPASLDWPAILSSYERLSDAGAGGLVLPDVVGDQQATFALLERHADTLRRLHAGQVSTLLAMQAGPLRLDDFYRQAVTRLGFEPDGLALPSHAAALPPESLDCLVDLGIQPSRVHILGVSRNSTRLADRAGRVRSLWPDCAISADACEHRAVVGRGRALTVARQGVLEALVAADMESHDDTESDADDRVAFAQLRALFPNADAETLTDLMCSGWGDHLAVTAARDRMMSEAGPRATRAATTALALR